MSAPHILDCTLRDGSYAIDFQFTATQTATIAKALSGVGIRYIEVGHGVGLGASARGLGVAAETDESYLAATAEAIPDSEWGMFCIPGIASLDDVDLAAGYGMRFIRVGTSVDKLKEAVPFIERAKQHGMFVCLNFMKSYTATPEAFGELSAQAAASGADLVYIVDSAGGMLPGEVEQYITAIRERDDSVQVGFHGHDNLGLAVANSLKAVEMGASIVDTSLHGLGRSAGNASTEQTVAALMRMGVDLDIDPIATMDIGETHIVPLLRGPSWNSLDVVCGLSLFHSSYLETIRRHATEHRVDPRHLIVAVTKHDQLNAEDDLVAEQARLLAEQGTKGTWKPLYAHYYGGEQ